MESIYIYLSSYQLDTSHTINYINHFFPAIQIDSKKNNSLSLFNDFNVCNSLILTDDKKIVEQCQSCDVPYIIILHENNKNISFPMTSFCIEGFEDIDIDYLLKVYQRHKNIPWTILETERLMLREITINDVQRLFELYEDKEVTLYMEDLFRPIEKEIEYTQNYINNVYKFYGFGIWVIVLKDSNEIIGRCGLEFKEGFNGLELGFMLGKEYWHKGYAFEACNAVLNYSINYLDESNFRCIIHKDNKSSINLCKKLGFNLNGFIDDNYQSYTKLF